MLLYCFYRNTPLHFFTGTFLFILFESLNSLTRHVTLLFLTFKKKKLKIILNGPLKISNETIALSNRDNVIANMFA